MAEAHVLNIITTHNKPFAVQGVVDFLQTQGIKKAAVVKALDALVASGKILVKEFGKTKIYIPPQAGKEVLSKEDLESRKAESSSLRQQLQVELSAVKELEAELHSWSSSLTSEQLQEKLQQLKSQAEAAEAKLAELRSGAQLVTPEEREEAEKQFRAAMDMWRKRKGVFRTIWDTISEGIDGKQADLYEEIGVDTDEAAGLSYKELEVLLPSSFSNKRAR